MVLGSTLTQYNLPLARSHLHNLFAQDKFPALVVGFERAFLGDTIQPTTVGLAVCVTCTVVVVVCACGFHTCACLPRAALPTFWGETQLSTKVTPGLVTTDMAQRKAYWLEDSRHSVVSGSFWPPALRDSWPRGQQEQ